MTVWITADFQTCVTGSIMCVINCNQWALWPLTPFAGIGPVGAVTVAFVVATTHLSPPITRPLHSAAALHAGYTHTQLHAALN